MYKKISLWHLSDLFSMHYAWTRSSSVLLLCVPLLEAAAARWVQNCRICWQEEF